MIVSGARMAIQKRRNDIMWGVYIVEAENQVHVMPLNGGHIDDLICWCEPYLVYVNPDNRKEVWSHRRGDN